MPTTTQISDIVHKVRDELTAAEAEGIHPKVSGEKFDDDWLYIEVIPAKPGVRASDHAGLMARIECKLRAEGIDQVLLLPALED
jgi:predicted RNA polymerase sigma factor